MMIKSISSLCALTLPLLLAACANTQAPKTMASANAASPVSAVIPKSTAQKQNTTHSAGIIDTAPKTIDTFNFMSKERYPEASLGYSLAYLSPQWGLATVYVYPVPATLAQQSSENIVKAMMGQTLGEIRQAESIGMYQDFVIANGQLLESGANREGRVYASYTMKGQPTKTAIYLTERQGKLFKIRISGPNAPFGQIAPVWDNFADSMFEFLIANSDKV